jgi:hypothetical protein
VKPIKKKRTLRGVHDEIERIRKSILADLRLMEIERDAYRAQATSFAEALVELGRQDLVDVAIEKAGDQD